MMLMLAFSFMFLSLSVSTSNFWILWIILESFSLLLTSFLMMQKNNSKEMMHYFFVQTVGSVFFFISVFLDMYSNDFFFMKIFIMHNGLFMKLGSFPFHSWTISFTEKLTWNNILVALGAPKMLLFWPFYSLFPFFFLNDFFLFTFLGGVMLPLKNLKVTSLKVIIAYTTIVHTAWIFMCCVVGQKACFYYFFFYVATLFPLCNFMNYYKLKSFKDLLFCNSFIPLLCLATFTGIPPFPGLLPKLYVVSSYLDFKFYFECMILGISSIFPIYLYMKLFFFTILKTKMSKNIFFFKKKKYFFFPFFVLMTIVFFIVFVF